MIRNVLTALLCASPLFCFSQSVAPTFNNPPSFSSSNHLLDLLFIARPETIKLGAFSPTAWVYEAARHPSPLTISAQPTPAPLPLMEAVSIPFSEIGDFVYHCHIGEHQDGGMMAHIRVITNP